MNDTPDRFADDADGRLLVVGGGEVAPALAAFGSTLGWATTVTEDLPADLLATLTSDDAVVVLSHDESVDGPALVAALAGGAGYVGAMGSRRTRERRASWLTEHGVDGSAIASLHTPVGLDLRADSPAEIAVAIIAEIIAVRRGAAVPSLQGHTGPLHPPA